MIAIDTNVLIYARREEAPHHSEARSLLKNLAEGEHPWALPWPCVYEFIRVVTHPKVFLPPTDLDIALEDLAILFNSPSLTLLGEGPTHRERFFQSIREGHALANLVHDAHIAALCAEHGVSELLTVDRDFSRFPTLKSRNPFRKKA